MINHYIQYAWILFVNCSMTFKCCIGWISHNSDKLNSQNLAVTPSNVPLPNTTSISGMGVSSLADPPLFWCQQTADPWAGASFGQTPQVSAASGTWRSHSLWFICSSRKADSGLWGAGRRVLSESWQPVLCPIVVPFNQLWSTMDIGPHLQFTYLRYGLTRDLYNTGRDWIVRMASNL